MADAGVSDKFAQVKGFRVDIDGAAGKEHDVAWEHVSGGALMIEHVETTIGSDKLRRTRRGTRPAAKSRCAGPLPTRLPRCASGSTTRGWARNGSGRLPSPGC